MSTVVVPAVATKRPRKQPGGNIRRKRSIKEEYYDDDDYDNDAEESTPVAVKRRRPVGGGMRKKQRLEYDNDDADFSCDDEEDESTPPAAKRAPPAGTSTARIDEMFRESCFKNAVSTITTNLRINIVQFTNLIGGQLTNKLPGNRLVLVINGQRYSVICYATGRFVLTNLFFFNRLKEIYDYFISFCLLLLKRGIATLRDLNADPTWSANGEAPSAPPDGAPERRLRIRFLIENCQFSFRFKNDAFQQKYNRTARSLGYTLAQNTLVYDRPPKDVLVSLLNHLVAHLERQGHVVVASSCQELGTQDKTEAFPADIIRLSVARDGTVLKLYKSPASAKRNKNDFNQQNISVLLFTNDKIIMTGMQIRQDLAPMFGLMYGIAHFFLPDSAPTPVELDAITVTQSFFT